MNILGNYCLISLVIRICSGVYQDHIRFNLVDWGKFGRYSCC